MVVVNEVTGLGIEFKSVGRMVGELLASVSPPRGAVVVVGEKVLFP